MRALFLFALLTLVACGKSPDDALDGGEPRDAGQPDGGGQTPPDGGQPDGGGQTPDGGLCNDFNPTTKNLYWGDVHVHTAFSHDAFDYSTPSGPAQAYAFAQGATIQLSPVNGKPRSSTIARPLDFVAVTDHAESLDHSSYGGGSVSTSWMRSKQATAAAYDAAPACKFTSLYGFEWSGNVSGNWYHRNVFFRSASVVPLPISAAVQTQPTDLWSTLDTQCLMSAGCQALTVPHNGNWSQNGILYAVPDSITAAQAKQRAKYEKVTEIYQHKGQSECELGVNGTVDPECGFEQQYQVDCGANPSSPYCTYGSYARTAIMRGLRLEQEMGVNPLKLGFIGSTDTHNATPGDVDEFKYQGMSGDQDSLLAHRVDSTQKFSRQSGGGIVAVWAPENRREEIFDALEHREAYASSGARIPLRFFGGWSLPNDLCTRSNLAEQGYQLGVPMGRDLPAKPSGASAPSFVVFAQKDNGPPGHPAPGLQYGQVIKVWYDAKAKMTAQKVYDVAGDKNNGADVDVLTCQTSGPSSASLCQVWTDPDFDATQAAAYYVRVLQAPTCTAHAYDCNQYAPAQRPAFCSAATTRLKDTERVWSSPIWYTP